MSRIGRAWTWVTLVSAVVAVVLNVATVVRWWGDVPLASILSIVACAPIAGVCAFALLKDWKTRRPFGMRRRRPWRGYER